MKEKRSTVYVLRWMSNVTPYCWTAKKKALVTEQIARKGLHGVNYGLFVFSREVVWQKNDVNCPVFLCLGENEHS